MRPSGNPEALQKRRERAISLLRNGHQPVDVARQLGIDRRSVRRWNAAYRRNGLSGIQSRPNTGRPTALNSGQKTKLQQLLIQGASNQGYESDLWTCRRIRTVIQSKFGINYHPHHMCRLVRSLGWTPQRPERKAVERDEKLIQIWVNRDWRRIKKKLKD